MKATARDSGEERHMKTTSLLVVGAALTLGSFHGLARSQEVDRCDVSNDDGSCRQAESTSEDQAASVAGAGSGERAVAAGQIGVGGDARDGAGQFRR